MERLAYRAFFYLTSAGAGMWQSDRVEMVCKPQWAVACASGRAVASVFSRDQGPLPATVLKGVCQVGGCRQELTTWRKHAVKHKTTTNQFELFIVFAHCPSNDGVATELVTTTGTIDPGRAPLPRKLRHYVDDQTPKERLVHRFQRPAGNRCRVRLQFVPNHTQGVDIGPGVHVDDVVVGVLRGLVQRHAHHSAKASKQRLLREL